MLTGIGLVGEEGERMSLYTTTHNTEDIVVVGDEDKLGWVAEVQDGLDVHLSGPGEHRTNGDSGGAEWRCAECGQELASPDDTGQPEWQDEDGSATCAGSEDGEGPHTPEPIPLSWANSAAVVLDEERDSIHVRISVGDPRGAFVMTVERMRYTEADGTEVDELRLSVPHPEDGWPHMRLSPLASTGYFRVSSK